MNQLTPILVTETRFGKKFIVGHQYYNPETKTFIFVFETTYPIWLRIKKKKELKTLAEALGVGLAIQ